MSTDTNTDDADRYTAFELRDMDEETARSTLTVAEHERWEKIHALYEQADNTRERWAGEDETVTELTVNADVEQLGTRVDVFGNDLLVRARPDDPDLRTPAEALDDLLGDREDEVADLSDAEQDAAAERLVEMLDAVLVRWNGTEWDSLTTPERESVLAEAQAKWGVDGLLLAWFDIAAAIQEDREERVDVVESFRNPERRGNR